MRPLVPLAALTLTLGLTLTAARHGPAAAAPPAPTNKLDHILLWGRSIDEATAIMAVKLGFQVKPGRNPAGVANRFIRMPDGSYMELLGITRPKPELDPGMDADQASLHGGAGSRSFGFHSAALDQDYALLKGKGFGLTPIFTAAKNDPDGGGPTKPPRWRLFAFDKSPLSSSLFYIDYAADKTGPANPADDRAMREHPNGARELSQIWLLSADANADKAQLERMGFGGAQPVTVPQLGARGFCVAIGRNSVLALQPDGPGLATDALTSGGPQVFGVNIGVSDLDKAQRLVERGYERPMTRFKGSWGDAFLAPTRDDLGLLMEFHAVPKAGGGKSC